MVTDSDTRHLNLSKSHIQMGRRGLRERLEAADKRYDCGDLLRIGLAPRVVETSRAVGPVLPLRSSGSRQSRGEPRQPGRDE